MEDTPTLRRCHSAPSIASQLDKIVQDTNMVTNEIPTSPTTREKISKRLRRTTGTLENNNGMMDRVSRGLRRITETLVDSNYNSIELAALQRKKVDDSAQFSDEIYQDSETSIKRFYDYRPLQKEYFARPHTTSDKSGLAVIIPFFNETSHELQQTLNSLYDTFMELRRLSKKWRDKKLYVCLIQDGWHKADKTMKLYLQDLFPKKINNIDWWEYFEEIKNPEYNGTHSTLIFEKHNYNPTPINVQKGLSDKQKYMRLSLIVKSNNRRKHNSHEWFLAKSGFAEAVNAEYLFLTDAFTFYSISCLYYLVKELDKNSKTSSVTGRQRLMTRDQQGSGESIFSFGYALRNIQLCDFELANAVYNGAFHLGGLLPVIPGPCGLYRASHLLQDNVRNSYFNVVNEEPHKTGLILGNLRIAEDRVLSYFSVTKTEEPSYMAFNPLAVFYFEAETDLQKLILQRRRWINGSIAGYIYLLFYNFSDFRSWNANPIRKIYIWILLMCQFITYCMVSIVPGISIKILYYGILYFMRYYGIRQWDLPLLGIFASLWVLYGAHVLVHNRVQFNYLIMYILVVISFLTTVVSYASIFHYLLTIPVDDIAILYKSGNIIIIAAFFVILAPFLLALMLSGRGHSFLYMCKSFTHYVLFLPLLVGWFGSYAYSRTWDLTWGNRPANELNDITVEQKDIMITKFKEKNIRIMIGIALINIGVFFVPLYGQYGLVGLFFCIALYQMFFSFIFCLTKIWYKIRTAIKRISKKRVHLPADIDV